MSHLLLLKKSFFFARGLHRCIKPAIFASAFKKAQELKTFGIKK